MRKLNRKLLKFILSLLLVFMISGEVAGAASAQGNNNTRAVSMQLYRQDGTQVGVYQDWKSVVSKINSLNQKSTVYRVAFSGDLEITGKFVMPSKGKYGGLILEKTGNIEKPGSSDRVGAAESTIGGVVGAEGAEDATAGTLSIRVSGGITPTADLTVGSGVNLTVGSISGKAWRVTVSENGEIATNAGLTVGELALGKDAYVRSGGKLDVKNTLIADEGAQLVLTEKKLGTVKNTQLLSELPLRIRVQNAAGAAATLAQGATVLTVTGDSYAPQFTLEDASGRAQAIYRKAKQLKVQGTVETPYLLYDVTGVAREEKATEDGDDKTSDGSDDDGTGDGVDQNKGDDTDKNTEGDADKTTEDGTDKTIGDETNQNTGDGADKADDIDQNTEDGADKTVSEAIGEAAGLRDMSGGIEAAWENGEQEAGNSAQPVNMGKYASLADIRTEINRRKKADAVYEIIVEKELSYRGSVACPSAKAYKKLIFSGEKLGVTGSLKLTGHTVFENVIELSGAVTGGKGTVLELAHGAELSTTSNLKAERLVLQGSLYVKGNVTVTDIVAGAGNLLRYNVNKKTTIKGNVTGMKTGDQLLIAPEKGGVLLSDFPEGIRLMNSVAKADTAGFALYQGTTNVFYRDKKALKLGMPHILLFEGTTDYEACEWAGSAEADKKFVTVNDMLTYVNGSKQTDFVARLNLIVPSAGGMTALSQGKHLILCGKNGERMTLQFTGGLSLDGCTLEVRSLILDNKTSAGAKVVLKNGAKIMLENTSVNNIAAAEGTIVSIAGETTLKGAISGKGLLEVQEGALVRCGGNVEAKELTLVEKEKTNSVSGIGQDSGSYAELRIPVSAKKKLSITNAVITGEGNYFVVNLVDKKDELASVKKGTVLVSAPYAQASQFRTDNVMPKTFLRWALERQGAAICTTEGSEGEGRWSGDYL